MKNMKRFLSVAMAVLMMFALVISASAKTVYEFDDTKDVAANSDNRSYLSSNKYFEDALQMMVDLEIITGRATSGELNLDASAPVTRLEFVTMLYKFMNGGSVPNESFAAMNPFTDIPWGAQYAGWAHSSGIAAGIGDNKFGSSNSIKMVDAVTFLIKALGVNTEYENFTGDNYSTQAMIIGNYLGLIPGDFSVASQNALTRAEVACLFNFALSSPIQKYTVAYNGTIAVYTREDTGSSAITKFFSYDLYEGEIVSNNIFTLQGQTKAAEGKTTLKAHSINGAQIKENGNNVTKNLTLPYDVGLDNVGRGFYVYAKLDNSGSISKYSGFNITGSSTTYSSAVLNTTGNRISVATNDAYDGDKDVGDSGTNGNIVYSGGSSNANIYLNYSAVAAVDPAYTETSVGSGVFTYNGNAIPNFSYSNATAADGTGSSAVNPNKTTVNNAFNTKGSGNAFRVVKNDYSNYYFIESLTSAKVTALSSTTATTAKSDALTGTKTTIKVANIIGGSVAVGDYILYAKIAGTDYYKVTKAELLEAAPTAFSGSSLIINGTNYGRYIVDGYNSTFDSSGNPNVTANSSYKFYLVSGKIIAFVSSTSTTDTGSSYCYVSEVYKSTSATPTFEVLVYSSTDTSGKSYVLSSSSDSYDNSNKSTTNGDTVYTGQVFKFAMDGDKIILKDADTANLTLDGTNGTMTKYAGEASYTGFADTGKYYSAGLDAGSVTFMVSTGGTIRVATNRAARIEALVAGSAGNVSFWTEKAFTSGGTVGTTVGNPSYGLVKVALIKGCTYSTLSDLYIWATRAQMTSASNGKIFGFGSANYMTDGVSISTSSPSCAYNGAGKVPVNFNPNNTGNLLRLERNASGKITNVIDGSATAPDITNDDVAYGTGAYSVEGMYEVKSVSINGNIFTITDSADNVPFRNDLPTNAKVYLIDNVEDVYKDITSSYGSDVDLDDEAYEYSFYAYLKGTAPDVTFTILFIIKDEAE